MHPYDCNIPRVCSKCKQSFPPTLEFFSRNGEYLRSICRICERTKWREAYHTPAGEARNRRHEEKRRTDPEMRKHRREYTREYGKTRYSDPEDRKRKNEYERLRRLKPEAKAREHERITTEEFRSKSRERRQKRYHDPIKHDAIVKQRREYRQRPDVQVQMNKRARDRYARPIDKAKKHEYDQKTKHNPDVRLRKGVSAHNQRAKRRGLPRDFTKADWQYALSYFGDCCAICGRPVGLWHRIAKEHWIAIADIRPGNPGTVPTNIVPMCHAIKGGEGGCNNTKSNRPVEEWLKEKFGARKANAIMKRINAFFQTVRQQGNLEGKAS